jgi:hypothetical protein
MANADTARPALRAFSKGDLAAKRFTNRLKAEQAAWLDKSTGRPAGRPNAGVDSALAFARVHAVRKLLEALFADIVPPGDATHVAAWDDAGGQISRYFRGTKRGNEARVDIAGSQHADGTIAERVILVGDCAIEVDAAGARQIAADLLAAAAELDRLARTETIPPGPIN